MILEAGLGGRQDATNIFTGPDVALSVITSVQLDHQQILGNTVDKIAMEKAGVMKSGVDVLVGPDTPLRLLQVCVVCFETTVQKLCGTFTHHCVTQLLNVVHLNVVLYIE